MIRDLHVNDLGFMVGTFYSNILGYDIEVMYDKDISLHYVEKILNILTILIKSFCWIYV